uniref:Uncharacterized protein n=1 Tax=uncultured Helicobacter sp. TaxID=175537 RepID=A0A650EM84_9HELI|nr:hypothetical protein Helico6505_0800 [uncultured Helicobacter sp.]
MALSTIGNITYLNQNAQLGSIQQANQMQKVDFMLNANMQEFVDRLKAVQEVSPAPQIEAIDPDDKRDKQQSFEQEQNAQSESSSEESAPEEVFSSTHLLDIRA